MPIILGRKLRSKWRGSGSYDYIVQRGCTWPNLEILIDSAIQYRRKLLKPVFRPDEKLSKYGATQWKPN